MGTHNGLRHNGESPSTILTQLVAADGTTLGFVKDSEVTTYARTFLDDADEATLKATLNLEAGTDFNAYKAVLDNADAGVAYTPTLSGVLNIDSSTPYTAHYLRVGGVVLASGKVDIDPTAGATLSQLGISLPVASDFAADSQCSGIIASPGTNGYGVIRGDAANNRAEAWFTPVAASNQTWYFIFCYRVI